MTTQQETPPASTSGEGNPARLSKSMTLLLAATVGMVVGNLYYMQPLLGLIAIDLGLTEGQVGSAATLSLIGQSFGMLLILPLGDIFNRRPLILVSVFLSICALLLFGTSHGVVSLSIACLALGLATTGTHMTISLAASLASPEQRGQVVGTVVGGLLTGLLLSRTISGFLGKLIDWQSIYFIAAGMLACLFLLLWRSLPGTKPQIRMGYIPLLTSMWKIFHTERVLRESCLFGSMSMAAFCAFWMTLAFHLERPPLNYGSDVAGLLGLLAIGGAIAAGLIGRGPLRRTADYRSVSVLHPLLIRRVLSLGRIPDRTGHRSSSDGPRHSGRACVQSVAHLQPGPGGTQSPGNDLHRHLLRRGIAGRRRERLGLDALRLVGRLCHQRAVSCDLHTLLGLHSTSIRSLNDQRLINRSCYGEK
jgi:predicted MFS family arabinose efflux permease